jgi:hypothetical protein
MEWLLGLAGIAVSIPIAWYFGRRNRERPDLRYALDFDEIVAPDDWLLSGGLAVVFAGTKIDRVSRTYVAIWNARGDTVNGHSVLATDPLRVSVDSSDSILQIRLVACSRPQIGVEIVENDEFPADRIVTFDFLDAGDGVVLEVLHHSSQAPRFHGTVMGANLVAVPGMKLDADARRGLRLSWFKRNWTSQPKAKKAAGIVAAVMSLVVVGLMSWLIVAALRVPMIVPIGEFEIDTLAGQRELAGAIHEANNANDPWAAIIAIGVWIAILCIVGLSTLAKSAFARRLPRSVVATNMTTPIAAAYAVGDRVHHKTYGPGIVKTITGGSHGGIEAFVSFKSGPRLVRIAAGGGLLSEKDSESDLPEELRRLP